MNPKIEFWEHGSTCCNENWESAYNRFETVEQEIEKFWRRLVDFGALKWRKDIRIVDLFCGSGRNLTCLERLGFEDLHGVDLSPRLLSEYCGNANLYVGTCLNLRFPDNWADVVIVQGGLHHLPECPGDVTKCLEEIHRTLKPGGIILIVEPWLTPMLRIVHWCCSIRAIRKVWPKLDALATMIDEESDTYYRWLDSGALIEAAMSRGFSTTRKRIRFGKLMFNGTKF